MLGSERDERAFAVFVLEVLDLLKIDQCTAAEVLDLLDPDRNAAELDSLLEALDL